jgi:hypothetical protein
LFIGLIANAQDMHGLISTGSGTLVAGGAPVDKK